MKKAKEVSDLHSPESLSPGCFVPWVSLSCTDSVLPCRSHGRTWSHTYSIKSGCGLVSLKVRALFCKAQRVRSQIHILNKNKKCEGIAFCVNTFAPRRVYSLMYYYLKLFSQASLSISVLYKKENAKCRYLSFTEKVTENYFQMTQTS